MRSSPVKMRGCARSDCSFIMVPGPGGDWLMPNGGERTVVRGGLARRQGGEEDFRWRGQDVSRIEGFSEGVFAFAICFYLLYIVWYEHYKYFRRYGLSDFLTLCLNAALLFLVLMYVYPLKFLFTLLIEELFGLAENETIETSQFPLLIVIYGAGFVAVQIVFVLMYLRAYSLRTVLELDARELSVTREEILSGLLNISVALVSVAIAIFGGAGYIDWSGYAYLLLFPLQAINGRVMAYRRKRITQTKAGADSD